MGATSSQPSFPYGNNVKGCKYRQGENTLTDGKESPQPAACPLADTEAVSSRELIVAADSGQTPGRCSWQADSSCSQLRPCGLLSRCNEIICYTGSSPEPYALLPTGQGTTFVVGTSMFWNPDQLGKKVCKCSFLNNGLFCILGHASSTAPTMLVGRSVGPPRWRSLDKNYSMVGHDIFLPDIMSLAPRRIKTTDLGGPVKATPREMCWQLLVGMPLSQLQTSMFPSYPGRINTDTLVLRVHI